MDDFSSWPSACLAATAGLLESSPIRFRSRLKAASLKSKSCLTTGADPAHTVARQKASSEGPNFRSTTRTLGLIDKDAVPDDHSCQMSDRCPQTAGSDAGSCECCGGP